MSVPPSFVPRRLLRVPGFFGEQEDVEWKLARDVEGAVRLARAREQHDLAFVLHRRRLELERSVPDIAAHLGVPRGNLVSKLTGRAPATEGDLIRWCWFLDEKRRSYRPEDLLEHPERTYVPRLSIRRP
ncbi:MAG: hypothetical protein ACRDWE_10275 [Acidimicrobiales bacterium]